MFKKLSRIALSLVMFAGASARLGAQWTRPDSGVAVFLVTAGPGSDPLSWFGHVAIVVADARRQHDYWYDYGIIDAGLNTPFHEVMGQLRARVARSSNPRGHLAAMESDDRDVLVQQLALTPAESDRLIGLLDSDVLRFGRVGYVYSHNADNCTTRIRDVIDLAVGGAFSRNAKARAGSLTFRQHGNQLIAARNVPLDVLADFITGRTIDQPLSAWDEAYLPDVLAHVVGASTTADGRALGTTRYRFVTRHHTVPEKQPDFRWLMLLAGISIGTIALLLAFGARTNRDPVRRRARMTLGILSGAVTLMLGTMGVMLAIAWGFTQYTFTWANENVLLANPLMLALVPASIAYAADSRSAARVLQWGWVMFAASALLAVALKSFPSFYQSNWREIAFVLPVSVAFATAFFLQTRVTSAVDMHDLLHEALVER